MESSRMEGVPGVIWNMEDKADMFWFVFPLLNANKLSLSEGLTDSFSIVINSGKHPQNSKDNVENLLLSYTKNPVAMVP